MCVQTLDTFLSLPFTRRQPALPLSRLPIHLRALALTRNRRRALTPPQIELLPALPHHILQIPAPSACPLLHISLAPHSSRTHSPPPPPTPAASRRPTGCSLLLPLHPEPSAGACCPEDEACCSCPPARSTGAHCPDLQVCRHGFGSFKEVWTTTPHATSPTPAPAPSRTHRIPNSPTTQAQEQNL